MISSIRALVFAALTLSFTATLAHADPCGMVPPIYTGPGQPITRVGEQMTYVFYKDGVETFVIRPGFSGKVDEFGMLIPMPSVPALRKVPDHIFPHVQAAIDPPEVVINLLPQPQAAANFGGQRLKSAKQGGNLSFQRDQVVVAKQEAVGMYEVAVLQAGSAKALSRWMDDHGYQYPKGMDDVCEEYVEEGWCFVAVKTKVGQKDGVDPKPAQRNVNSKLPSGSTFDGNVQGMGFRFKSDELVVPMRLSAFNAGELRNIVYIMTDKPQKIRSIPEEYVVRQITGEALHRNVTGPLPLRIIGGTEKDLADWHRKNLPAQRNPEPKNGAAKELFASDLKAIASGELSLEHEEKEKELLAIGERMGLRGTEIDKLHADATREMSRKATDGAIAGLKDMSLTVVDGDFPRDVLARKNLQFAAYNMPARRNSDKVYDAKTKRGAGNKQGVLLLGAIDWDEVDRIAALQPATPTSQRPWKTVVPGSLALAGLSLLAIGLLWSRRRWAMIGIGAVAALFPTTTHADPCGMVPPVYIGEGQPITRVGLQQTYVFYKDGVETFVIRPGFRGNVEEFGMLIPFPNPPAVRKVPDHIFPHIAAAVDPPEVVVDLRVHLLQKARSRRNLALTNSKNDDGLALYREEVRVVKQEAVGMYEVAVLEAGSAAALKKWMDQHGYKYPEGMDGACEEYVKDRWCFVAVKTKVAEKEGVDPKPAQRNVNANLPSGSAFDGHVQAMGFRFESDELVVPMRLASFNAGELRNVVYLLTDKPQKIRSIPEEYVVRQVSGDELFRNVSDPLPLRIIGGTEANIPEWQRKNLPQRRNPTPHNGAAKELFAGDLQAIGTDELTLPHEEKEKDLLAIGERLGLRGKEVDSLHAEVLAEQSKAAVKHSLAAVKEMSLTVVDGDFPREVLARKNLTFGEYQMPARRNGAENYDAKINGPAGQQVGVLKLGAIDWDEIDRIAASTAFPGGRNEVALQRPWKSVVLGLGGFSLLALGLFWNWQRHSTCRPSGAAKSSANANLGLTPQAKRCRPSGPTQTQQSCGKAAATNTSKSWRIGLRESATTSTHGPDSTQQSCGQAAVAATSISPGRQPGDERPGSAKAPVGAASNVPALIPFVMALLIATLTLPATTHADPCGMVPPVSIGEQTPITRIGEQKTFVFYKDGVETFVIRPGFEGKTEEFGMLIPFPNPPALRKVPDHVFPHVAAAIDPPEVVVDLRFGRGGDGQGGGFGFLANQASQQQSGGQKLMLRKNEVRVVKQEAVGMYEVAVLEAGSAAALKKWMDKHGYKYPEGMDKVCEEYVEDRWCFVAVKTKVGQKDGVDPQPAQRDVNAKLPAGATFDGHVQAMGFRFKSEELVVPMRLSAFNAGELRNIVYLLTDKPQKIRSIPEEYVVRQVSGEELHRNLTGPLPLRIIGGTEADIPDWQRKTLPAQRDPKPHNAAAKDLMAGDLLAVSSGELSLAHEEEEKDLLAIGERLGLRGNDIDKLHTDALAQSRDKATDGALADLKSMTLTVVDGDFPREVLARKNLAFGEYRMPSRRNSAESYDAKNNGPGTPQMGNVILGHIDWKAVDAQRLAASQEAKAQERTLRPGTVTKSLTLFGLLFALIGIAVGVRRRKVT